MNQVPNPLRICCSCNISAGTRNLHRLVKSVYGSWNECDAQTRRGFGRGRLGKNDPDIVLDGFFWGGGMRGNGTSKGFKRRISSSPGSRWMVFS